MRADVFRFWHAVYAKGKQLVEGRLPALVILRWAVSVR
jgi:hypothetical protein